MELLRPPTASAPLMSTLFPREKDGEGTIITVEGTKTSKRNTYINPTVLKKRMEFCMNLRVRFSILYT